jgi:hypothetical protein
MNFAITADNPRGLIGENAGVETVSLRCRLGAAKAHGHLVLRRRREQQLRRRFGMIATLRLGRPSERQVTALRCTLTANSAENVSLDHRHASRALSHMKLERLT